MNVRSVIEEQFRRQVEGLGSCVAFGRLESGEADEEEYRAFVANLARTHLRSPQYFAFLCALAPPDAEDDLFHNLLEELGFEEESGESHPALLARLVAGAGLGDRLSELEALATDDLRRVVTDPFLFGSLREVSLAALLEVIAFEFMLSRVSGRMEAALATNCGLDGESLAWLAHHAEVDVGHAEQGLCAIEAYVRHYGIGDDDVRSIVDLTFGENVFIRRYFSRRALSGARS